MNFASHKRFCIWDQIVDLLLKVVHYARIQRECHFVLILLGIQQSRLVRIREKAAFRHNGWIFAVITQKKLLAALLYLASVFGLQKLNKAVLQRTGERLTLLLVLA